MSQKKLVKQLLKKLDKLEAEREKLIDKLAKALESKNISIVFGIDATNFLICSNIISLYIYS